MTAAGVPPQEAVSNLAAWAKLLGFDKPPAFLLSQSADTYAFWTGGAIVVVSLIAFFLSRRFVLSHKEERNTVKPDGEDEALTRGYNRAASKSVSTRDAALFLLTRLRTEGVVIRNSASKLYYTGDLDGWINKVTEWMNNVIRALKPLDEADSEWFATLDVVQPARVPIPNVRLGNDLNQRFASIFCQHDLRLSRLDDLLKKYGVGAIARERSSNVNR